MQKNQYPMPSDRLWKTLALWCWLFMGSTALMGLAFAYRLMLLSQIPSDLPMSEYSVLADYLPQAEAELWTTPVAGLLYLIAYVACIFLVLKWYLRSVRNARAMFSGIETSPGFVIWAFIIPFISLWKPYGMTSELWRSGQNPDGWRGDADPALMRWWWGAVIVSGLVITVSAIMSRAATTVAHVTISDATLLVGYVLQIVAGLMFVRIAGPISQSQTRLIAEGRARPTQRAGEFV